MLSLVFGSVAGFGQKKACPFLRTSISRPDSIRTKQLVQSIAAMQLEPFFQVDKIPDFIKKTFQCWNDKWAIANPDQPYNETDVVEDTTLPWRQLTYIGLNEHYMLMAYKQGGWGTMCRALLFRFDNEKIISVMYWVSTCQEIKTKEEVLKSLKPLEPMFILTI